MQENPTVQKKRELITPKNDYCFKRIFGRVGNEEITKELLNLIIDDEIKEVKLDYKEVLDKDILTDKAGILDIKAKLNNKIWCDIEIQVVDEKNIEKRILYYWSKLFSSQLKSGENYEILQKTVVVLITNYEIKRLKNIKSTLTKWKVREDNHTESIGLK